MDTALPLMKPLATWLYYRAKKEVQCVLRYITLMKYLTI